MVASPSVLARNVLLPMYVAQFFLVASYYAPNPIVSLFAVSFGATVGLASLVVATGSAAPILAQIPVGIIADKRGRNYFLYAGGLLAVVGPLFGYFSTGITWLILTRIFAGMSFAAFLPLTFATTAELAQPGTYGRSMGSLGASLQSGVFLGPLLGGFIAQSYGYRDSFLGASLLGCASLGVIFYTVKQFNRLGPKPVHHVTTEDRGNSWVGERNFLGGLLGPLVTMAGGGVLTALIPIYLVNVIHSANISQVGVILATGAIGQVVVRAFLGSLSDRVGRKKVLITGLSITGTAFVILLFRSDFLSVAVIALLNGVGTAFVNPAAAALVADSVPAHRRGVAMGMYQTSISVGMLVGTAGVGLVADGLGFISAFTTTAAMEFVMAFVLTFLIKGRKMPYASASAT